MNMNFEESMNRLNQIVELLDSDKLSLDKSLDYYKEGIELTVACKKMLENAKLSVETMNGELDDEQ